MSLSNGSITALLAGTLTISALHALIPSHWFAFALVGRAQRWTMRRTLIVTLLAGAGHVLLTVVLGFFVVGIGKQLQRAIPPQAEHMATAALLILLGIYFAYPTLRGEKGCHHGHAHDHDGPSGGLVARIGQAPTVMGALILGMTLSPCLDLLSVYVAASSLPWKTLAVISLVMALTTLTIMLTLVWLTMHGLSRLKLRWLEQNEGLVVGGVLMALGVLLFFL